MTSPINRLTSRLVQTRRLVANGGAAELSTRVRRRLAAALAPDVETLPLDLRDLGTTGSASPNAALPGTSTALHTVRWVFQPPGPGSGGHTTIFRMITALERAGVTCTIHLHDRHAWPLERHVETIRSWWPQVGASIHDLSDGLPDGDVLMATSWDTAYLVRAASSSGHRGYFVQDFEPSFYAAGSNYLLAEATYRFGFHGFTAGRWLADMLGRSYGMEADHFDFGCDLSVYRASEPAPVPRAGVCFYSRPSTPRRAHQLGMLALELFAQANPDVEIIIFGEPPGKFAFEATVLGLQKPVELADIYRRCVAGLSLSATNVSLVPHEMLAAGCIPVVNDAEHNRIVLANDHVVYAAATPWDLATALGNLVRTPQDDLGLLAKDAAASVAETTWEQASGQFVAAVQRLINPSAG